MITRSRAMTEEISSPACGETLDQTERLKAIVRDYRNLFKSWRQQVAALSSEPRFSNLTRLLANHFKEELPTSLKQSDSTKLDDVTDSGKKTELRKQRLGRGFQRRAPVDNAIPGETRKDKQLRKGVEAVKDVNYFKAVCCYSKVSKALYIRTKRGNELQLCTLVRAKGVT